MTKPSAARERILETAHQLFYRYGIRATGIDLIIRQAAVTKVTFYRHFPAKNQLILAFLDYRHQRWIQWFRDSLSLHHHQGQPLPLALAKTLEQWFNSEDFRGCAFTNTAAELADTLPEAVEKVREHKREMTAALRHYLPPGPAADELAQMLSMAVDGAIVTAQRGESVTQCLAILTRLTGSLVQAAPL